MVGVIAKVARKGIGHTGYHWAGWIDDELISIQVKVRQTAKGHGIRVAWGALDGALHPQHTALVHIGFQQRYGRGVGGDEVRQEVIVPVKNDHAITAEVKAKQLCRDMHIKRVPGASDGSLHHGTAPWIVRLEYGVLVRRIVAVSEGVVNDVVG